LGKLPNLTERPYQPTGQPLRGSYLIIAPPAGFRSMDPAGSLRLWRPSE
jgi:hypothetical protein